MSRALIVGFLIALSADASATTYQVGPTRTYHQISDVTNRLNPGDVVEVDGDATYASGVTLDRSGNQTSRITIRGIRINGKRPILSGNTRFGFEINADYTTIEGFEITGGITKSGIGQYAHEVVISDCLIHDFPDANGIMGYGTGTGNTTIEYTEIHHTGNTAPTGGDHQIYMATDEHSHPGSVFRLQYCYIHDAIGNSNVKSRSERNEIYYNWLEKPGFHDMDLYGIDPDDNPNVVEGTAREDSDVVGNVVICNPSYACARIGGDGTGNSKGRFRFVNNTFIQTGNGDIIRTFQDVETLEMYNNVLYNRATGSTLHVLNDSDGSWVHGSRTVIGSNNFIVTGATDVPAQMTGTIAGTDPGFVNASAFDFTPAAGSALLNAGASSTPTLSAYPFANPLFPPAYLPPVRSAGVAGSPPARAVNGVIDLGAFEGGVPASIAITTTSLPSGTVGIAYSQALRAVGGTPPYAWSIAVGSLPAGLVLDPSTGAITGTPTSVGNVSFTVRVTDSHSPSQSDDQILSITISARADAGIGLDAARPPRLDAAVPGSDASAAGLDASHQTSDGGAPDDTDGAMGSSCGCSATRAPVAALVTSAWMLFALSRRRRVGRC